MPETKNTADLESYIIHVSVTMRDEVEANRADLSVTIQGSSLITGDMAQIRAREVGQLVADLKAVGVDEADVTMESVTANTISGLMGKTSSATYSFRVVCRDLKQLPDVLGAVTAQKNSTLNSITWRYPNDEDRWLTLLDRCLKAARQKSARIASGLGVRLLGVRRFTETRTGAEEYESGVAQGFGKSRRIDDDDLGMDVSHSKQIGLRLDLVYRVSGIGAEDETVGNS